MGREYITSEAERAYKKQYYQKNRDRILARQKEYREKNQEKIAAYQKQRSFLVDRSEYKRQYYQRKKAERLAGAKYVTEEQILNIQSVRDKTAFTNTYIKKIDAEWQEIQRIFSRCKRDLSKIRIAVKN